MAKYYHKVIGLIKDEWCELTIEIEEIGTLKEALVSLFDEGVTDILFAGTCEESDLEYFGNDCIVWEEDYDEEEEGSELLN